MIGCENVEVEPDIAGGDADIAATLDGKRIVFQVKSLFSIKSKVMLAIIETSNRASQVLLKQFGVFAKVMLKPRSPRSPEFVYKVLEHRKVPGATQASYGVFFVPVDSLTEWILPRIFDRIKRSYRQLSGIDADYKVVVIDLRGEPINERLLLTETQSWLFEKNYPDLSGVIYMRQFSSHPETVDRFLILVPNTKAKNPLYPTMLTGTVALLPKFVAKYLFLLPIHIKIPKPGEHELIRVEPGFKIYHNDKFFGTLTLP